MIKLKKGLISISLIFIIASVMVIFYFNWRASEIVLIPDKFEGEVLIFFNVKNGGPEEYEKGIRLYKIPSNGILKTQFPPNSGWGSKRTTKYYYYDQRKNKRIEIPYSDIMSQNNLKFDSEEVIVFSKRYITGISNNLRIHTTEVSVLVGEKRNVNLLYKKREESFSTDSIER